MEAHYTQKYFYGLKWKQKFAANAVMYYKLGTVYHKEVRNGHIRHENRKPGSWIIDIRQSRR